MKVSISQAAKMVGIQRSTFYRHVDEKGISIEDKDSKRPKVDVSELIRIYGGQVKTPEQIEKEQFNELTDQTPSNSSIEEKIELQTLRERVKHVELLHDTEKKRLEEQVELLKDMLESEREERKKATMLLTDQRGDKDRQADRLSELEERIKALSDQQNSGFFKKLFGPRSKAAQ